MKREENSLVVYVDEEMILNETLQYNGDLLAEVLYLGGLPQGQARFKRSDRIKRQLGISSTTVNSVTTVVTGRPFKGTLTDIRVSIHYFLEFELKKYIFVLYWYFIIK